MNINMKVNYHTHTMRCGHAVGTEREYVEKAIAAGMTTLGFSDHCPFCFPDGTQSGYRMQCDRIEDYTATLLALREEYKKDLRILIGYEMEYYPTYFDQMLSFVMQYPIDYLLLGQHFLENEQTGTYVGNIQEREDLLTVYVDQVLEGLSTGVFTYVTHPDVARFTGDPVFYEKQMTRLCEGAKKLDIPLEINFLGLKDGRHYPCDRFFRIAHEVGNKFILGCDAHDPKQISDSETIRKAELFCEKNGLTPLDDVVLHDPKCFWNKK